MVVHLNHVENVFSDPLKIISLFILSPVCVTSVLALPVTIANYVSVRKKAKTAKNKKHGALKKTYALKVMLIDLVLAVLTSLLIVLFDFVH